MEKKTWLTRRFVLYILLLLFGLVFTQALRSSASAVLFLFLLIFPVISFIIALIGKSAVKVYVECDNTRAEKDSDITYEIKIINDSFIPFPFTEAHITVPSESGVRCVEQKMMIPLNPFEVRTITHSVRFHYRGEYEIGVLDLRIKDPLGLFSVSLEQSVCRTVIVYPRMMEISSPNENAVTEMTTDLSRRAISSERSEQANIREYVGGDSLKDIHWKLSAKVEDILVRDYNTNNTRHTYIIADMSETPTEEGTASEAADKKEIKKEKKEKKSSAKPKKKALGKRPKRNRAMPKKAEPSLSEEAAELLKSSEDREFSQKKNVFVREIAKSASDILDRRNTPEKSNYPRLRPELLSEISEMNCDRVVELTVAAVLRELRSGSTVTLIYKDPREKTDSVGSGVTVRSYADTLSFAAEVLDFACVPVSYDGSGNSSLFSLIEKTQDMTVRIISADLTPSAVAQYCAFASSIGGGGADSCVELYFADDVSSYTDPVCRGVYVDAMCGELNSCAVKTLRFTESAMPDGTSVFVREEG